MSKEQEYITLCTDRKDCKRCEGHLKNASKIAGGKFDCDEIGAYLQWQGNLDAELMVVAQDFADEKGFLKDQGWAGERVQTNLTLVQLVAQAGIKINQPKRGIADDQLFFTNAVLCMKHEGMQANISESCFRECARRFLRPTIELVAPKVVVKLGARYAISLSSVWNRAGHEIGVGGRECYSTQPRNKPDTALSFEPHRFEYETVVRLTTG